MLRGAVVPKRVADRVSRLLSRYTRSVRSRSGVRAQRRNRRNVRRSSSVRRRRTRFTSRPVRRRRSDVAQQFVSAYPGLLSDYYTSGHAGVPAPTPVAPPGMAVEPVVGESGPKRGVKRRFGVDVEGDLYERGVRGHPRLYLDSLSKRSIRRLLAGA